MKVRDVMRRLRSEGWHIERTRGDHRQYAHDTKPGIVTVPGHPSDDLTPKTLQSIHHQAGWEKQP